MMSISKKISKTLAKDGGGKLVDLSIKNLQSFKKLVKENQKGEWLLKKSSWPMPKKKNRKVDKNRKFKLLAGENIM